MAERENAYSLERLKKKEAEEKLSRQEERNFLAQFQMSIFCSVGIRRTRDSFQSEIY